VWPIVSTDLWTSTVVVMLLSAFVGGRLVLRSDLFAGELSLSFFPGRLGEIWVLGLSILSWYGSLRPLVAVVCGVRSLLALVAVCCVAASWPLGNEEVGLMVRVLFCTGTSSVPHTRRVS